LDKTLPQQQPKTGARQVKILALTRDKGCQLFLTEHQLTADFFEDIEHSLCQIFLIKTFFRMFDRLYLGKSVSAPEEEPYSIMFGSLKHPIRRKILRMLMEKPRSFSEMLECSGVTSSHLTYHLENLGQLVSKTDDGKYRLSTFGEAAVAIMSRIEETSTESRHTSSFPLRWKSLFVALLIGLITLAAISYAQYQSLNRVSDEYGQLSAWAIAPFTENLVTLNSTLPNATYTSSNLTSLLNPTFLNGTELEGGITMTCSGFTVYPNGTIIAYGPIVTPCHLEKLQNEALVILPDHG
jgi:DNA-binding transcriptional ArsR family regulator